jgi:hypothetical protein
VAAAALVGLRVDGVAFAGLVLALAAVARWREGAATRRALWRVGLVAGAAFAAGLASRLAYHGDLLPNTVYAKMGLPRALYLRGLAYVGHWALTFVTPLLLLVTPWIALRARPRAPALAATALAFAAPVYAVLTRGDFMAMHRFLVPGLPFFALVLGLGLGALAAGPGRRRAATPATGGARRRAAALALGAVVAATGTLPAFGVHLAPETWRARLRFRHFAPAFRSELEQWRSQAQAARDWARLGRTLAAYGAQRLAPGTTPSVVATAIGALGYHSRWHVYDQAGLVEPRVGRRRVSPDEPQRSPGHDKLVGKRFFLADAPTLLHASLETWPDPREAALRLAQSARRLRRVAPGIEQAYVPELLRVPAERDAPEAWLLLWRRIDPARDGSPRAAREDFERRVHELAATPAAAAAPTP